jgi:hypothetical protein
VSLAGLLASVDETEHARAASLVRDRASNLGMSFNDDLLAAAAMPDQKSKLDKYTELLAGAVASASGDACRAFVEHSACLSHRHLLGSPSCRASPALTRVAYARRSAIGPQPAGRLPPVADYLRERHRPLAS